MSSGPGSPPASVGRRAARLGRVTLFLVLAACWGLVIWRALRPPVTIPLPGKPSSDGAVFIGRDGFGPGDAVFVSGGRLPGGYADLAFGGVFVGDFWIDRFEVTKGAYSRFLLANPDEPLPYRWTSREPPPEERDRPVVHVSLEQARRFAAWRGGRIPTVHEWEWAAFGSQRVRFPWGTDAASIRANTREAGFGRPIDVGMFVDGTARFSGCYDMVGNVAEWTDTPVSEADQRRYIRGGNYTDPLVLKQGASDLFTIMQTHDVSEGAGSVTPLAERLSLPRGHSSLTGFRCAYDSEVIEARVADWEEIASLVQELGTRDPISTFLRARVAREELRKFGTRALPLLRIARRRVNDQTVRDRLDSLISEVVRGAEASR